MELDEEVKKDGDIDQGFDIQWKTVKGRPRKAFNSCVRANDAQLDPGKDDIKE